jgi:hypothetical protein
VRRTSRRSAAVGVALVVGLSGLAGCDNGSEIEQPATEEPDFETQLPDADSVDEQAPADDAEDDFEPKD